jgi:hypothetical protein
LTALQKELLGLLATGPRYAISDSRVAKALERRGMARYYPKSRAWDITAKGRKANARRIVGEQSRDTKEG